MAVRKEKRNYDSRFSSNKKPAFNMPTAKCILWGARVCLICVEDESVTGYLQ